MIVLPLVASLFLSWTPAVQADAVRALAVQYADGRRTVTAVSTIGRGAWTTAFPRIAGADTSRDGLRLFALQFEEAPEPSGVAITIALLYGTPQERRVPVVTVHLNSAQPIRVEELTAFGVQPIVLSLVPLPPAQLVLPSATTPSSELDISVETVTEPVPAYHATIVNHGTRDVMMLAFKGYRGDTIAMSGRPRKAGRLPLIRPGDAYVIKLNASARPGAGGATEWLPLDRLVITSVLWSDDIVEGDGEAAADEHALDAGSALQLDRALVVLRAAARDPAAHPSADLRERMNTLSLVVTPDEAAAVAEAIPGSTRLPADRVRSTMAAGMRNAKSAILNDIDEWLKEASGPSTYPAWLAEMVDKYAGWRTRIRP